MSLFLFNQLNQPSSQPCETSIQRDSWQSPISREAHSKGRPDVKPQKEWTYRAYVFCQIHTYLQYLDIYIYIYIDLYIYTYTYIYIYTYVSMCTIIYIHMIGCTEDTTPYVCSTDPVTKTELTQTLFPSIATAARNRKNLQSSYPLVIQNSIT